MILNIGQNCNREGMACTFPCFACFGFGFSGYSREFSLRLCPFPAQIGPNSTWPFSTSRESTNFSQPHILD